MARTEIIECDICNQTPDPSKGYLMLGGGLIRFTANGPAKQGIEQYFCAGCALKLLEQIEKLAHKE